jgi:hypothetical protein
VASVAVLMVSEEATTTGPKSYLRVSEIARDLEVAPIGWQLFTLGNSLNDQAAVSLAVDTFVTRLLARPLRCQRRFGLPVDPLRSIRGYAVR